MKRFKADSHVRGAVGSQGYYTQPSELLEAVVTDLNPDGDIRIHVLRHTKLDIDPKAEFEVAISEIELIEEGG